MNDCFVIQLLDNEINVIILIKLLYNILNNTLFN